MSLPFEIENIRPQINSAIEEFGADLLDIFFKRFGNRSTVTFIVDKPGGVTLEDCVRINHRLSQMFDDLSVENGGEDALIQGSYFLEVNSPGLDRPLKDVRDYVRANGQTLRVIVRDDKGRTTIYIGKLASANETSIELMENAGNRRIELASIVKAVREIQFRK